MSEVPEEQKGDEQASVEVEAQVAAQDQEAPVTPLDAPNEESKDDIGNPSPANLTDENFLTQDNMASSLQMPHSKSVRSSSLMQSSKMMSTGVSAFGATNATSDMMRAMIHQRQVEDQQTAIKSRIIKLLKEEERANKRIKDLQRRQDFVGKMHKDKKEKMELMNTWQAKNKMHEDMNRSKFNHAREQTRNTILTQRDHFQKRNRSTACQIKDQQKKIADIVNLNRNDYLKEKQSAYKHVKDQEMRAKANMQMSQKQTETNGLEAYSQRIKNKLEMASRTQGVSRELENQEQQLLSKLQKTYQNEKKMVESLYQTNALSPIKTPVQPPRPHAAGNYKWSTKQ